tara:strand:+ start:1579 stop:1872 length:294 start_codon:yes stop_codon:yes gene_type:complete
MADVVVRQAHSLSLTEAQERMGGFQEMMGKYGVTAQWQEAQANLKGMGVSGSIVIEATEVVVTVKLGMMAKAVGVDPIRLKASIEKRLKAAFVDEGE